MNKLEREIQAKLLPVIAKSHKIKWVDRSNSGKVKVKGGWMQLHEKGTADLIGMSTTGRFLGFETKTPENYKKKDHGRNEDQIAWAEMINSGGGLAGCYCDIETLNEILEMI